jgi:hypothetical protein
MNISTREYKHRGHTVKSSIHSIDIVQDISNSRIGKVPASFQHRPDLISKVFYNRADMFWKILVLNNIADPFEKLNSNDNIYLP